MVKLPVSWNCSENCAVPLTSAALSGVLAPLGPVSVVEMVTVSPTPATGFQLASTALTVKVIMPVGLRLTGVGVPVLPVGVPGAAVSPGSSTCSWVKLNWANRKNPVLALGRSVAGSSARLWPAVVKEGRPCKGVHVAPFFTLLADSRVKPASGRLQASQ